MKNKKYCPFINGECKSNCMFRDDIDCNINEALVSLIDLSCLAECNGINVNASLYKGDDNE